MNPMLRPVPRQSLVLLAVLGTACASRGPTSDPVIIAPAGMPSTAEKPPNEADVHFMSGMIPHHAQAVLIAGWAPSHGASAELQRLCERIVVAQRDEIRLMQDWLRQRNLPVPAADATHHRMEMGGMVHEMLMPGMLTDEELAQLDRARGEEFDRLFLVFMIRHHEGALTMVEELYQSYGAAQDEMVFRFSSDVWADQTAEIERMQLMLAARGGAARP